MVSERSDFRFFEVHHAYQAWVLFNGKPCYLQHWLLEGCICSSQTMSYRYISEARSVLSEYRSLWAVLSRCTEQWPFQKDTTVIRQNKGARLPWLSDMFAVCIVLNSDGHAGLSSACCAGELRYGSRFYAFRSLDFSRERRSSDGQSDR